MANLAQNLKAKKVGVKTTDLKIAKVFSEDYRNGVIHRGTAVNERRALEILQATINLLEALSNLRLSYHNNA